MNPTHLLRSTGAATLILFGLLSACTPPPSYDLILRGGTLYDGSGGKPFIGDVAIDGDSITALGDLGNAVATTEIDVSGLAVAPGFVNMMSWANESLIEDGRSQSNIRQGVTLEIMGEGNSMGPLNDAMKDEMRSLQSDIRYEVCHRSRRSRADARRTRGYARHRPRGHGRRRAWRRLITHVSARPVREDR
jgi:N-acyl-D-amino-acid deacylase